MYPSAIAPLLRSGSTPDLSTDPISLDLKGMTEKLSRTRNFWSHGLKVAASSLIKIPPPESIQQQFQQFQQMPQPSSSMGVHEPFILNPSRPPPSQQFHLTPPSNLFSNFPPSPSTSAQQPESQENSALNDSLDHDSISSDATTVIKVQSTTSNFTPPEIELKDIKDDSFDERNSFENISFS